MKKLILLFALFGFLTFTTACGGGDESTETTDSVATETPEVEAEPEVTPEPEVEPMESDSTVEEGDKTPVEKVEK
jgi:hypothetical protein